MILRPKQKFELLNAVNVTDIPDTYLSSHTLAKPDEIAVYAKSLLQSDTKIINHIKPYVKQSYIIEFPSSLPVIVSLNEKKIFINALAVVNRYQRFHPKFICACISCGCTLLKPIPFNELFTTNYLTSMFVRVFGKKYGLITTEKKHQLSNVISKYVNSWRNDYEISIDVLIKYLNQTVLPDVSKAALIAQFIKFFGIVGLTSLEDYYRMIGNVVASTFKINIFKPTLFTVNNKASETFIKLWLSV